METNFVKLSLTDPYSGIYPLLIPAEYTKGTGLCNPSIYNNNGTLLLNIRNVEYTLYHSEGDKKYQSIWGGPLAYLNPEDDLTLRTVNFLGTVSDNGVVNVSKVNTSNLDTTPMWEFIGLEDARIAVWDDNVYLIGVRRDTETTGIGRMEFSKIENSIETTRNRIEPPDANSYCEKNWMPIIDMPYHFVKWTNPTEVVKVDLISEKSKTVVFKEQNIDVTRDIRGGSQVIPIGNYRVCITHEVDLFFTENNAKDAHYFHRFIVWDKNWNIVCISDEFKLMTGSIEFATGMAIKNGMIYITFGYMDNCAYMLKFSTDFLQKFLKFNFND